VIIHLECTNIVHTILVNIHIDRDWINSSHINVKYEREEENFIQFAQDNECRNGDKVKIRCHCVNCLNERKLYATKIRKHLLYDGFLQSYTIWA